LRGEDRKNTIGLMLNRRKSVAFFAFKNYGLILGGLIQKGQAFFTLKNGVLILY